MSVEPAACASLSDIDDLIHQAERVQLKLAADLQFQKNMAFFKNQNPLIYQRFEHYTPSQQQLVIDDDGHLNLLNIDSGNLAYNKDPQVFAKEQADNFMQSITRYSTGFKNSLVVNPRHIHPRICNAAIADYEKIDLPRGKYNPKDPVGLLVMIGCGLGYQIKAIVENHDVKNLFIYDSNDDSFYASFFTVDWEEIALIFNQKGGKLKLNVGEDPFDVLSRMRLLVHEIGFYNMVFSYVYTHTSSSDNDQFIEYYKNEFQHFGTSLGFFDDEQVSFSHTLHHLNHQAPFLLPPAKPRASALPPVVLVGNGPSLDGLVDFLQAQQDKAIIISCGSSLSSLYKLNIVPDIHVELERNLNVADVIKLGTSLEYTKQIPLLALNTVAPEVTRLFKQHFLACKPNDLGSTIVQKALAQAQYTELDYCNPTVTNCGLAFVLKLGFQQIYLAGIDLALSNSQQHHSKYSLWQSIDEGKPHGDKEDSNIDIIEDYTYSDGRYSIKGNFCEQVTSSLVLDNSRRTMEILIDAYSDVEVFNLNNGAYIRGAKPTRADSVALPQGEQPMDKPGVTEHLLADRFAPLNLPAMTEEDVRQRYISLFVKIRPSLDLPETCQDMAELYQQFQRVFKNLNILFEADQTICLLVRGSIQVKLALICYFCSLGSLRQDFQQIYCIGQRHYQQLLDELTQSLLEDPLRLDDTPLVKD